VIAAIYARKSTEQSVADEAKSVTRQIDHARQYAARKGWTVDEAHVYVDDGISGAEFLKRPGFLRLMNALKPRAPFQVLVMSEESRLGREAIETAYALKQLIAAGVRVFFYLEDRERTLDSPTDKIMLSLTTFADELEREKARQRTYDAMHRLAQAGHVTGGRLFGYDNVEALAGGIRSHVDRRVNEAEAAVVRRIFELSAGGYGIKAIAKRLNAEGAPSPRAQRGRSQTWAPSSVREVLYRDLYRGLIVWNRTRKRDRWGAHRQTARPVADRIDVPAPHLRIVPEDVWQAAHARLATVRRLYLAATGGQAFGRPPLGDPSKYLLTGLSRCGRCSGPLKVLSRDHGQTRQRFYGCSGYHDRGRTVCENNTYAPMEDVDGLVIEALLDDVLDLSIVRESVDEALQIVTGGRGSEPDSRGLDREIAKIEQERARLVSAIASGGPLDGLLAALQAREARLATLQAERDRRRVQRPVQALDATTVRRELLALAEEWRTVLAHDQPNARPIVTALLTDRVTITPTDRKAWTLSGAGTLAGLFSRNVPRGMASPPGFEPGFQP
jgi:site-specific DNA recombinase